MLSNLEKYNQFFKLKHDILYLIKEYIQLFHDIYLNQQHYIHRIDYNQDYVEIFLLNGNNPHGLCINIPIDILSNKSLWQKYIKDNYIRKNGLWNDICCIIPSYKHNIPL